MEIVTVCADTPEQIRKGRKLHGARAVMLADPDLEVTTRYNLRNENSLMPKKKMIGALPIPTTFLVDSKGTVRWIDQSEDFLARSDPSRVLGAIRENLAGPA